MLRYLDINKEGDFKLDIANFKKQMQMIRQLTFNLPDEEQPSTARFKAELEPHQRVGMNIGSDPASSDNSRVEEVDSKYEQSPP